MSDQKLKIIAAGAGSGKTYRLTHEMFRLIDSGIRIDGIIATTFTQKAAAELQERLRQLLLDKQKFDSANELTYAMIGTVHSIGVKLLQRFAFEVGVSPEVSVMAAEDAQSMFNAAFSFVLTEEKINYIEELAFRLGKNKKEDYDWRKDVMKIVDVARANNFDAEVIEKSKKKSFESFAQFLPNIEHTTQSDLLEQLKEVVTETIENLRNSGDETKTTADVIAELNKIKNQIEQHQNLEWFHWVKLLKLLPAVKSRDLMLPLQEIAARHESLAEFQDDIKNYIHAIFDAASAALIEFQLFKKRRGLIDYTDMEVLVKKLLVIPDVQYILEKELDLLMVDEFQDTSPLQLDNFLQLSRLAKYSIWVGDPKQSIYGFRGADPSLMEAIIQHNGGIKTEDIQRNSYRSRPDLVFATNAIFTKAFSRMPENQVALEPMKEEIPSYHPALNHWHFKLSDGGKTTQKSWLHKCIADVIRQKLNQGIPVSNSSRKGATRNAVPGDIAILCRTNGECLEMAAALNHVGLKAAISRTGLLETAEIQLILACLKYMLQRADALSVAEILRMATNLSISEIIRDRLQYVANTVDTYDDFKWGVENEYIQKINDLREKAKEFSAAEILDLLIDELQLREVLMHWGNVNQRFDNIDILRKMVLEYEETCNRKNSAASLGGFLLWLNEVAAADRDVQAAGESRDAVNVLTYHRSKGLEWPIVICHSMENELSDDVWNLRIISEKVEIDLNDPLGNRYLQYWVNPYADLGAKTPLLNRIKESDGQKQISLHAAEEETRLLYVGMTRAAEYLIFVSRQKATKWLNRVCSGDGERETLDPEKNMTEWEWNKDFLPIQSEIFVYEKEIPAGPAIEDSFYYFNKKSGRRAYRPFKIELDKENLLPALQVKARLLQQFDPLLAKEDDERKTEKVEAISAILNACLTDATADLQNEIIQNLVKIRDLDEPFAAACAKYVNSYDTFLRKHYQIVKFFKNYPLKYKVADRIFETEIDVLAKTETGFLVIRQDNYYGDKEVEKAQSFSDWAFWVRKSLEASTFEIKELKISVHFIAKGKIYELV